MSDTKQLVRLPVVEDGPDSRDIPSSGRLKAAVPVIPRIGAEGGLTFEEVEAAIREPFERDLKSCMNFLRARPDGNGKAGVADAAHAQEVFKHYRSFILSAKKLSGK